MYFDVKVSHQKQYNWRFWFKLLIGIVPLVSIVVFFVGQTVDLFDNTDAFWNYVLNGREDKFTFGNPRNWSAGQSVGYLISRNAFMITTIGNILAGAFFINSAVNNKNEGYGKRFDNYRWGMMVTNTMIFIVIFYNGSLIFTNAVSIMKWYNYVSWICEHLVFPLMMIVYYCAFYPKRNYKKMKINFTKREKTGRWFSWMATSIMIVIGYNILFVALGQILNATHAFPIFGDMSSDGYFPYSYMDWNSNNWLAINIGHDTLKKPAVQFVIAIVLILVEQIIAFAGIYATSEHQRKKYENNSSQMDLVMIEEF